MYLRALTVVIGYVGMTNTFELRVYGGSLKIDRNDTEPIAIKGRVVVDRVMPEAPGVDHVGGNVDVPVRGEAGSLALSEWDLEPDRITRPLAGRGVMFEQLVEPVPGEGAVEHPIPGIYPLELGMVLLAVITRRLVQRDPWSFVRQIRPGALEDNNVALGLSAAPLSKNGTHKDSPRNTSDSPSDRRSLSYRVLDAAHPCT